MNKLIVALAILLIFIYGCDNNEKKIRREIKKQIEKETIIRRTMADSISRTLSLKPVVIEKEATGNEKKLFDEGHDLWYNGSQIEGIQKLDVFLKNYPNSPLADDAQEIIGTAYTNLKDYKRALEAYAKVSSLYPNSNKASISFYDIAHVYFYSLDDYENAEKYYELFIHNATDKDRVWIDYAIENLVGIKLKPVSLRPKPIKPYSPSNIQETSNAKITSSNPQEDFKKWLVENTSVIDVHYESDWQIWVTLEASKYTSTSNVKEIARTIARWYAKKMNKDYAICTVWLGSSVYAKGDSN